MKIKKLALLPLLSLLIVGCNNNIDSKDTPKNDDDSGSEVSPTPSTNNWPTALESLMKQYCGEVLPYVSLGSGLSYDVKDYEGSDYLFIYDEASSSKIDNYGTKLENAGWSVDYDEDYECYYALKTSSDGLKVYQVVYYFADYEYGNCLECSYSLLSNQKDTSSSWNDSAKEIMINTIGETLPFVNLGVNYTITSEENFFEIYDDYYQSLQDDIINVLTSNDYEFDKLDEYGDPIYVKTLSDSSTISVNIYYYYGNVIDVTYDPYINTSTSWPSDVIKEFETASGYSIPQFIASSYEYYQVGNKLVIYADVDEDLEESYLDSCLSSGFVGSSTSVSTFEETLSISFEASGDYDSYYNFVADGFTVTIEKTTPTSTFVTDWPTSRIEQYLSENNINVKNLDALKIENSSNKQYKIYELGENEFESIYEYLLDYYYYHIYYGSYTEEKIEQLAYSYLGLYIELYDNENLLADNYYNQLANIPYYVEEMGDYGRYYAEDASGELGLYYYSSSSVFSLQFTSGSGETHQEEFSLSNTSMNVIKGQEVQLSLTKSMLVGDVTWTSSDSNVATVTNTGKVTINSEANKGDTATITATLDSDETYTASCTFTVIDKSFARITSLNELVSGARYLIVSEGSNVAFDSSSSALSNSYNYVSVTASEGKIAYDEDLESATFTITEGSDDNAGKYSICTSNGEYINQASSGSKKFATSSTPTYHTISFSGNNVNIEGAYGGYYLMYNTSFPGFRYYSSVQAEIQLYRLYE